MFHNPHSTPEFSHPFRVDRQEKCLQFILLYIIRSPLLQLKSMGKARIIHGERRQCSFLSIFEEEKGIVKCYHWSIGNIKLIAFYNQ